jgi:CRP-like cAMP-binding protein
MESLRAHPFLEGFRPEDIENLAGMAFKVHFDPDQVIFREGDESSFFYLVLEGKIALETHAPGRTLRIQTLGPGDELGWSSVLSPVRKQFQARCLEPVRALAFDGARLLEACNTDCTFGLNLMRRVLGIVAERLQATRVQLLDLYQKPAGAKTT